MRQTHGQPAAARLVLAALICAGLGCTAESSDASSIGTQVARLDGPTTPITALLGLEVGRGDHVAVAFAEPKKFPFDPRAATISDANVKVEVFTSVGELLGVTEAHVTLCDCPEKQTHYHGDVEVPHETMVLIKVAYLSGDERIRISRLDAEGGWREVLRTEMPGGER